MTPALAATLLLSAPRPREFVTRFQQTSPAIAAKGVEDTAFYRYAAAGAERRRRRPRALRHRASTLPRRQRRAGRGASRRRCSQRDARHQALRATSRARIAALRGMRRRVGASRASVGSRSPTPLRAPRRRPDDVEQYLLFQTLVGAWPIGPSGSTGTCRRRCARPSATPTGSTERDMGAAVIGFARALLARARSWPTFEPSSRARPGGRAQRARPAGAEADLARRARHLPGRRAVAAGAGRSRQPPARRLAAVRGAAARMIAGGAGRRDAEAVRHVPVAVASARRPETFHASSYDPLEPANMRSRMFVAAMR